MEQITYYGYIKSDKERSTAFADAITVNAQDFDYDDERSPSYDVNVSAEFRRLIPATIEGRCLSGLRDVLYPTGRGIKSKEFHAPVANVMLTDFGAIFYSHRGEPDNLIEVFQHLRKPGDRMVIWWHLVDCDPVGALSGTIVIDREGARYWEVPGMVSEILEGTDQGAAALNRLVADRESMFDLVSRLIPSKCPSPYVSPTRVWIG